MSAGLADLLGDLDPLESARWDALQRGRIEFQRCRSCGGAWLPPRSECPGCLSAEWDWETASGRGELVSWVVYHRAFHPAFGDRVPYAVALVELAEGPRMVASLEGVPGAASPTCGAAVELAVVERGGVQLAEARLA